MVAENTLYVYGAIGDEWDGLTDAVLARQLDDMAEGDLTVRINSPGGIASMGKAIYNLLKDRSPTVVIDGLAASAASVIAMAGGEIVMATGATMMIHDAWGMTIGPASEHAKMVEELNLESDAIASIYAERTGLDADDVRKLMVAETWYTGEQAVEAGFATEVRGKAKAAPKGSAALLAAMGVQHFSKHLPKPGKHDVTELNRNLYRHILESKREVYRDVPAAQPAD